MVRRPTKDVEQFDLPSSGTIRQSQVIAEFNKGNNLRAYLGADSGVPTSGNLKLTDFYGKSASDAVDSWTYDSTDYIEGLNYFSPGSKSGINRSKCPWNATGAAFDKTSATKGTTAYSSAMTCTHASGGGGSIVPQAYYSGFDGAINSQYPNNGATQYCDSLFPFQKLKPGNYRISGNSRAYGGSDRWAEAYLYMHFFSTWSMSGGVGYVSGAHGSNKKLVLGGRQLSSSTPQTGTFTVPEGYEYVCVEFRNANNVYSPGMYGCSITNIVVTKASRIGSAIREKISNQAGTLEIPDEPEEPLPPDSALETMEEDN